MERQGDFAAGTTSRDILGSLREQQTALQNYTNMQNVNFASFGIKFEDSLKALSEIQTKFNALPTSLVKVNSETQKQLAVYTGLSLKIGRSQEAISNSLAAITRDLPLADQDSEKMVMDRLKLIEMKADQISRATGISFRKVYENLTGNVKDTMDKGLNDFNLALRVAENDVKRVVSTGIGKASKLDDVLPELQDIYNLQRELQRLTGGIGVSEEVMLTGTREEKEREIFNAIRAGMQSGAIDADAIASGGMAGAQEMAYVQATLGNITGFDKQSMDRMLKILATGGSIEDQMAKGLDEEKAKLATGDRLQKDAAKLTREELIKVPENFAAEQQISDPQREFGGMLDELQKRTIGTADSGIKNVEGFKAIANAAGKIADQTLRISALAKQFGGKGDFQGIVAYSLLGGEEAQGNLLKRLQKLEESLEGIGKDVLESNPEAQKKLKEIKEREEVKTAKKAADAAKGALGSGAAGLTATVVQLNTTLKNLNETFGPLATAAKRKGGLLLGDLVDGTGSLTEAGKEVFAVIGEAVGENLKNALPKAIKIGGQEINIEYLYNGT